VLVSQLLVSLLLVSLLLVSLLLVSLLLVSLPSKCACKYIVSSVRISFIMPFQILFFIDIGIHLDLNLDLMLLQFRA
jgi:hypothetical protein